ncbi:MAG: alpha/beta hydrolase [Gammaproteobacteria bacterium HGW-Gammaproteobacteria-14]|nr:MAG: alpha/beta hydrolase [Gammaproteobacteria bacterium HGW-Gammaproteobacteria-14]
MSALFRFLAVFLLLSTTVIVGISWAPDRPVDELTDRWAPPPSTFIEIDGMQVHLRDEGPRNELTPLVLIHGTSASLHTWDGWTEGLVDGRRVVRFDLPAFGLTGPAPDNDYTAYRYANFVFKVMDRLGIDQALLAGNSLGGHIALEAAMITSERVAGLVLVDAAGYPFEPESMPLGFRIAQIPAFAPLMNRLLPRSMIVSSVESVYGDPSLVTPALVDRYYELTLREGNRAALVERFGQMAVREDVRERAKALNIPTLLIWGDLDRLIPPHVGEDMHTDIPASELVRFANLGHVPHEEAPEATLAAVKAFIERRDL